MVTREIISDYQLQQAHDIETKGISLVRSADYSGIWQKYPPPPSDLDNRILASSIYQDCSIDPEAVRRIPELLEDGAFFRLLMTVKAILNL